MQTEEIISNVLKAGAFLGGVAAVFGVRESRKSGIRGDERDARRDEQEQRRDTVADRDELIDQLQEDRKDTRARLSAVEHDIAIYRIELAAEKEYSRLLLDWGYRGAPPPPPQRPNTIVPS